MEQGCRRRVRMGSASLFFAVSCYRIFFVRVRRVAVLCLEEICLEEKRRNQLSHVGGRGLEDFFCIHL